MTLICTLGLPGSEYLASSGSKHRNAARSVDHIVILISDNHIEDIGLDGANAA